MKESCFRLITKHLGLGSPKLVAFWTLSKIHKIGKYVGHDQLMANIDFEVRGQCLSEMVS